MNDPFQGTDSPMQFLQPRRPHVLCLTVILWSFSFPLHAEPLNSETTARVERILAELMDDRGIPGLSIAIADGNEPCYARAFGLADVEHDVPATPETRFRTASIAKSLTAAVVLSLAEDGAIDLDAEVQTYCPDYPVKQWPLTPRHLLGHLGGVRHYKSRTEASSTEHFYGLRSALASFADDPLRHEPGTRYLYTSFGYNLLGSVAEGAGGRDFSELLKQRVLEPAGMSRTVVDDHWRLIPNRSRGYIRPSRETLHSFPEGHSLTAGELYNSSLHDTSMKIPGGGLLSTPTDLVRFATALNTGQLLQPESRERMWTSGQTSDGKETGYGYGWRVGHRHGRKVVSHTGGQSGTSTVLLLLPETGTCVAIMCNLQSVRLQTTAEKIAATIQPPSPTDDSPVIEKLESAVRYEAEQKNLPAFSISLVDDDRVVWASGFGFQDASGKIPATADSVYRVGSISKLFTDLAVLQLVAEGKLDLDAPITTYLPDFQPRNPYGIPLTLRQMMSHRSGLVRESPVGNYFDPDEPTLDETVASLNGTALVYKPETKTKYSNAALAVVGAVLERQFDLSHPERVRQTILEPLGMTHSGFVVTPELKLHLATGWMRTYDLRRFEAPGFLLGTGPAGNMYSSVLDLSKFLHCLFADGTALDGTQLISPDVFRLMSSPILDSEGRPQGFGLGFHVQELDGHTLIGHGGAVYGFSTQLEALPERKLGVAAVASLDGSNGVVRRLTDYALRLMLAQQDGKPLPSYRTTGPVPPERAGDLVGTYREPEGTRFARVTELNGDIFLQRGDFRYELRAAADDGTIVTDDPVGFGTAVRLEDGGRLVVGGTAFVREPDEPPAEISERWRGLIGEYGWDHNTLYILEDQGQLFALIEWFYYYPLTEVGENLFEFPDYGLYHGEGLRFTRNAAGRATEVVAAEVKFVRRDVGTGDGETFRIKPVKPIEELRAGALAASPPAEQGEFRESDLVELARLDPTIRLDIRYASTNNFTGAVFYKQSRAFLQRPAAAAVVRANQRLKERGLGLLVHDAYRPWHVTKMFWDATPDDLKAFVANPANGSRHNRGCAVDLTLYDLPTGEPIQMVAGYDEFTSRAFPLYPGGTARQRWYRDLLRQTMEQAGFTVYENEWWHFDFADWKKYRIGNATFEEVLGQ